LFSLVGNIIASDDGERDDPANVSAAAEWIAKGADVDAVDSGQTLLIRATQNGHVELMKVFLEHGADVNGRDDCGQTALIVAAGMSDPDMVQLLLSKGADVNIKDNDGFTAWSGSEMIGGSKEPNYVRMRRLLKQAGAK
jgi:ankyrin repeat protein